MDNQPIRIAIVVSHPIQHFCPQYASFAKHEHCHIKVFFGSALGYKKYTDTNFNQEISWGNLRLNEFEHRFLNGEQLLPADNKLDAPLLDEALLEFAPSVLISYGYFQPLQRRAYRWARKNGVPIAYISDSEYRHKSPFLKRLLKAVFLRRYFSGINYFLTVGDANEAFYRRHGVKAHQMIRMHFPIDIIQYKESYEERIALRKFIRSTYDIGANELVLSVVGKLSPWKNQDHLIDAMKVLEERGIYTHAFILGSGAMKEALERRAGELKHATVHFPGFVAIEALPAYYAATDIYVHPASLEPHSIAISEAIFMGCPVIVSDRSGSHGSSDDVQDGVNGLVFVFGDINALVSKIEWLAADKERREAFGRQSHKIALAFQDNAHYKVLAQLLKKMQVQ